MRHSETALIQTQITLVLNMNVKELLFAFSWPMNTVAGKYCGPWIQGLAGRTSICRLRLFNHHKSHGINKWTISVTFSDNDSSQPRSRSFVCQKHLLIRFIVFSLIWYFYVFLQLIWNIDGSLNLGKTHLTPGKIFRTLQRYIWIKTSL